ncbi:hypothetical protein [Ornithinibacillus californiensis]|uniref:hypothetical protein n=1 Tax=Ornithinibacillus californiensis TaxID=161536 RepID=UPI00064D8C79|nr:hypothetical protein [Ornithinibacillus californiensis]
MKNKRLLVGFVAIGGLLFAIIWGSIFIQSSTVEKVVGKMDGHILEQVELGEQSFVIFEDGNFIKGGIFEKGFFGWKEITESQAIDGRKSTMAFSTDYFAITPTINGWTYLFGYVKPDEVDSIKFQYKEFETEYKVNSYYWYIPVLNYGGSFEADQLSVILKDGREIFYPFDELR